MGTANAYGNGNSLKILLQIGDWFGDESSRGNSPHEDLLTPF